MNSSAPSLTLLKRLVSAFEALSLEEQILLNHRQYEEMVELQTRSFPLASRIAELVGEPSIRQKMDPELRQRIRQIISSFQAKVGILDEAMHEARVTLAELDSASLRARTVRPVYGAPTRQPVGAFSGEC